MIAVNILFNIPTDVDRPNMCPRGLLRQTSVLLKPFHYQYDCTIIAKYHQLVDLDEDFPKIPKEPTITNRLITSSLSRKMPGVEVPGEGYKPNFFIWSSYWHLLS